MNTPINDNDIVILAGARTPFGNLGGALAGLTATDLAVAAAEAAIARSGVAKEKFDEVVFGNVIQCSADAIYLARHVGLRAGLPIGVPALIAQPAMRLGPASDALGRPVAGARERDLRAGRRKREHEAVAARRARRAQRFSLRTKVRWKIRSGRH